MADNKLKTVAPGLDNFRILETDPGKKLTASSSMKRRLVVSILDRQYEREGRSTVALFGGFEYHDKITGRYIKVPRTYVTDFASVPGIVRGLIESFGRHARAAVLHDWLYAINEGKRKDADRIALRAMTDLGVGLWKRAVIYRAIRLLGKGGWKKMREEWKVTWANPETGERTGAKYEQQDFHNGNWPNDPELGF